MMEQKPIKTHITPMLIHPVLDACCGGKSFWYEKDQSITLFQDIRREEHILCDGRTFKIDPEVRGDVTHMCYEDESFMMVVFDPPHLIHAGESSWLRKKYGVLPKNWKEFMKKGFEECFRVLKSGGVIIFKWNSEQIPFSDVVCMSPYKPLFGDRRSKTRWTVFMKDKRMWRQES